LAKARKEKSWSPATDIPDFLSQVFSQPKGGCSRIAWQTGTPHANTFYSAFLGNRDLHGTVLLQEGLGFYFMCVCASKKRGYISSK
jgi:hypothetical protein